MLFNDRRFAFDPRVVRTKAVLIFPELVLKKEGWENF